MNRIAPFFIIIAGMLWGMAGIFVRAFAKIGITSMEIVVIRATITAISVIVFLVLYNPKLLRIKWKDLWCFIGTGICSIVFFNYCYFKTITLTSLSTAAILLYTAPIIVMLFSVFLFHEKLTRVKLIAIFFAFGGCFLVTGILGNTSKISAAGLITGLGAGLGYALYSVFGRYAILKGYHPLTITVYTFIIASAGSLPLADVRAVTSVITSDLNNLWLIILFAMITTVLPYFIYTIGLSYVESGSASIMASIEPVVATLVGILVFHEKLTVTGVAGIVLVILSIIILNRKSKTNYSTEVDLS